MLSPPGQSTQLGRRGAPPRRGALLFLFLYLGQHFCLLSKPGARLLPNKELKPCRGGSCRRTKTNLLAALPPPPPAWWRGSLPASCQQGPGCSGCSASCQLRAARRCRWAGAACTGHRSWLPSALQEAGLGVTDGEAGGGFPAVAE